MVRRLIAALLAWCAAAVAAAAGLTASDGEQPVSVLLFSLAAILGGIGGLLFARGMRHRAVRRRAAAAAAAVTLARLEYLATVTTRTPLLLWRGDASPVGLAGRVVAGRAPREVTLTGSAQRPRSAQPVTTREDPGPASSTTRPRTGTAEVGRPGR
jgi:hypothetical protein